MKKTLLALAALLSLAVTVAQAQFTCITNNGAITITGYAGSGTVIIPAATNDLPVTGIGIAAFDGNTALTSVEIPGSVTTIGTNAFLSCTSLTNTGIAFGVLNIQRSAFQNCTALNVLNLPASVTNLGTDAFYKCTNLAYITFLGNAPASGVATFSSDAATSVYFVPGATGWSNTFASLSTYLQPFDYVLNPANTNTIMITGWTPSGYGPGYIPSTIVGLPVTAIGDRAFANQVALTGSLAIPSSVTSIGDYAFLDCFNLMSISFANGLASIGAEAFVGCYFSGTVDIPSTVTNIGFGAFSEGLRSYFAYVVPPDAFYTNVNANLFDAAQGTLFQCNPSVGPNYVIPATVTNIAPMAFVNCPLLTNITIPNGVLTIGSDAFAACSKLKSATIPASVTSIGAGAFANSFVLSAITVDPKNTFYGSSNGILYDASQSTLLECPAGFSGSYGIPSSVTRISSMAFSGCNLSEVDIPATVTNIDGQAFAYSQVTAINVDPQNNFYSSVNGVLFNANQSTLIQYPGSSVAGSYTIPSSVVSLGDHSFTESGLTNIVIPNGVTNIGPFAFADNSFKSIILPGSIASIGDEAFVNCGLNTVTIPAAVTYIGSNVFLECASLATVTISNGVTALGYGMFDGCILTNVTIPASVTNIGEDAFANCLYLTRLNFQGNAPAADSTACSGGDITNYYLPGATGWYAPFGGAVTVPWIQFTYTTNAGTLTITGYTGPGGLAIIPATINGLPVTTIGSFAFDGVKTITGISIPSSVTNIESSAFQFCSGLASITIPGSVVSIGTDAFYGCASLTNVVINPGVKIIGNDSFQDCSILSNVIIGNGVTSIQTAAFSSIGLTNIVIPQSVVTLGAQPFYFPAMTAIYFAGNSPAISPPFSPGATHTTIYYLPGTTGWSNSFAGLPTAVWTPLIATTDKNFGVQNNGFGFDVNWAAGQVIEVDVSTGLTSAAWSPLETLTLTNNTFYFSEPFQSNSPGRYFRVSSP